MLLGLLLSLSILDVAITGTVKDTSGGAISGASVVVRTESGAERQTVTGPDGRFTIEDAPDDGTLVVRAGGFAEAQERITGPGEIEIVLLPATLFEMVTVTSTRTEQRLGDVPASISVLDAREIRQSPAVVADDVLRRVPTFSLFRRTSSLSSHPTSQGVSLRGIGPSGVSRTLVLLDNVPFNDPFGGWVYWTRVPLTNIERIEVVDGASSSLYGNYAMGGVINLVSSRPARRTIDVTAQYGNRNSPKVDYFGSDVWGRLGVAVEGSAFTTDGFPVVVENERGPIDTKATVDYRNVNFKADYRATERVTAFVRGGYFREERNNAKFSTFTGEPEANDTTWKSVSGGVRAMLPDQSDLQARVFSDFVTFDSNNVAVPDPVARNVGRISLIQHSPSKAVGGMAQWSRAFGPDHYVTAGTDWRWIDGDSNEDVTDPVTGRNVTTRRVAGGTQRSFGVFVQDLFTPVEKLTVTLSARLDNWKNYDGHNLETSAATGLPTPNNRLLPERSDTVVTPRLAALYHLTDQLSVWGSISGGFRAPTLNELYRSFRVGLRTTLANDQLGPERLTGGELGLNIAPGRNVTVRTTWFDNRVVNPVSNVTRTDLVNTVQRQNLGRTRIRGIQTDAEYRRSSWRVSGGYLYNQAKVREAVNPALIDNYLPQVPKHRGSVDVVYSNPQYATVGFGIQFIGRQFDDDLNSLIVPGESEPGLPGYALVDVTASRAINGHFEAFVGIQNLFDEEYFVGTQPTTIGSPRLVHGGIRVRWTGR